MYIYDKSAAFEQNGKCPCSFCGAFQEVPSGIEPLYLVLQTSA